MCHDNSPEIDYVIDELAPCLASKEAPEITVKVCVLEFRTASDERTNPGNKYLPLQFIWHTTSFPMSSFNQLCDQQKQDYGITGSFLFMVVAEECP